MHFPLIRSEPINNELPSWLMLQVKATISDCFDIHEENKYLIKPLTGGYSASSFVLSIEEKSYVTRLIKESEFLIKIKAEIYAMKHAASLYIASKIHFIAKNEHVILMDFIDGRTLKVETSKKHGMIVKVAGVIRKVHKIPKNPLIASTFEGRMEK